MARSGSNCSCILKRALSCEPPRPNSADHRNGYLGALVAVRHVQAAAGDLRCVTLARFHSWRSCRARSVSRTMSALVLALGPPVLAWTGNFSLVISRRRPRLPHSAIQGKDAPRHHPALHVGISKEPGPACRRSAFRSWARRPARVLVRSRRLMLVHSCTLLAARSSKRCLSMNASAMNVSASAAWILFAFAVETCGWSSSHLVELQRSYLHLTAGTFT